MEAGRIHRIARVGADLGRAAVLVSGLALLVRLSLFAAAGFLAVLAILVLARALQVPPLFDAAFCWALLLALWASAQQWYVSIVWMDEAVHVVATGATAAAAYLMLARLELLPDVEEELRTTRRASLVLLLTILGLGMSAVWEFLEWIGEIIKPDDTITGYDDTIIDMMLGGLGALVAGVLLLVWAGSRFPLLSAADEPQPD